MTYRKKPKHQTDAEYALLLAGRACPLCESKVRGETQYPCDAENQGPWPRHGWHDEHLLAEGKEFDEEMDRGATGT